VGLSPGGANKLQAGLLQIALGVPLGVLVLGAALGWAFSGFRANPG
jgi:hypothetical protein